MAASAVTLADAEALLLQTILATDLQSGDPNVVVEQPIIKTAIAKIRAQVANGFSSSISFTVAEAQLLQGKLIEVINTPVISSNTTLPNTTVTPVVATATTALAKLRK